MFLFISRAVFIISLVWGIAVSAFDRWVGAVDGVMIFAAFHASSGLLAAFGGVGKFAAICATSRPVYEHRNTVMLVPEVHGIRERGAKHSYQDSTSGGRDFITIFQKSPYFVGMDVVFFKLLFDIF